MIKEAPARNAVFSSLEEETFLNLQRAASTLFQAFTKVLRPFQLTPTQYNALRVLRRVYPDELTCGEIGEGMITPEPDVTRLVDRLVARGLVSRQRDENDRRVVRVSIAEGGLELLELLEEPVHAYLTDMLSHLREPKMHQLIQLLKEIQAGG